jgi:hypothetical protein
MHSAALALAWYVWTRHRRGLTVLAGYWLLLAVLAHALPASAVGSELVVPLFVLPGIVAVVYLLGIFSFSMEARLEMPGSGFPARLWALPLPTRALVGWPMLWGTSAMALAWLVLAGGALRPCGFEVALWWPAVVLAAALAWLQAVAWSPFPLSWLRPLAAVGILTAIAVAPLFCGALDVPEWVTLTGLAALLPAAYFVAVAGVARARRGDVRPVDWTAWLARFDPERYLEGRRPFASAGRAQLWMEWRRAGRSALFGVGCCLVIWLPLLPSMASFLDEASAAGLPVVPPFLRGVDNLWLAAASLLWLPLILATAAAGELGELGGRSRRPALSSFLATRPVTCWDLVRAKLQAAAWSTLATWLLVAAGFLLWLAVSGRYAEMAASFDVLRRQTAAGPFWCGLALLVGGAVLLTWLQMVQGLWLGLSGRNWVRTGFSLLMGALMGLVMFYVWLWKSPGYWETFHTLLPWLAAAAVVLKAAAAGWALREAARRRLVPARVLVGLPVAWLVVAAGLFALLRWLVPSGLLPASGLVLGIVLLLPLTRLALAPLALAWNRHR